VSEQNKAVHRRLFEEVWNGQDLSVVDELAAPDFVNHGLNAPPGAEGFKQFVAVVIGAFPDIHFAVEGVIAEGDKTVVRWTATGTHQDEFMGIPATGKAIAISGIAIDRFEGGKIVESWDEWDALGMMQQLGAIPPAGG